MAINIETYALCKKYCDTHASTLTPEQAVQAVANYFNENPDAIVTNEELETILEGYLTEHQDISGKLNVLPKVDDPDDPGFGWEYHIPYRFDVSLDAEKANVDLHTLTLDNNVTKMTFNKQIPSATNTTAGLMSADDKTNLENKLDILPKVDDPDDPGFGWEYHIPYSFDAVPDEEKLNITLKTLTLDNKWTKMNFDKALPGASTSTAGLMTAADKNALTNKIDKPAECPAWLNPTGQTPTPWFMASLDVESEGLGPDAEGNLKANVGAYNFNNKQYFKWEKNLPFAATTTKAGLMSAADKTKLDSLSNPDLSAYAKTTEVSAAVNAAVADLVDGAPETLDTLKELAENFDGMATQAWVESKGYVTEALPEGTEAGQALIYDGEEWSKQIGYGYELAPETNINFDGDTTGLTEIATAYFPFYKLSYDGYLPTAEDLMGQTVYYKYNGSLETSEWNADDVQMSPEGTLELMKDNFADTIIIVYDDVTMSKYDDGLFTKGIWVAKQDDNNYIMDIYFGPVVNQIDSKFIPSDDNKANVDDVVNLTEDQTIGGEKEFTQPIRFESGLSTTSYGQGGVSIGAFAQPTTKYNFATDGSDYVTDGEVTVASREWVEAQGYSTESGTTYTAGDGIEITDDNVINSTATFSVQYVTLEGTSGTLTDEELATLQDNALNYIYLDGTKYTQVAYAIGRGGIFATYSANPGINTKTIIIAVGAKTWEYSETAIYDNSTILNSSNKLAVNSDLTLNTITTTSTASFNNGSLLIKKLANNKPGVIGSGSIVLNRNTSYNEENIGENSVIVGMGCHTQNQAAIAAGKDSIAGGSFSCAINQETKANAVASFAQGYQTWVSGVYSQAFGKNTIAAGGAQTVLGQWNIPNTSDKMIVGTGTGAVNKGSLSATNIIGYYYANANPAKGENKYVLITAENADTVWNDSNIKTVYNLNNAIEVKYTGEVKMNALTDGTTTRSMSDLLAVKIQPITLAEYQALTTKDSTTLYVITN